MILQHLFILGDGHASEENSNLKQNYENSFKDYQHNTLKHYLIAACSISFRWVAQNKQPNAT